jgi:hypothetical protein
MSHQSEYQKMYRESHKEILRQQARERYQRNKERISAKRDPDKKREYNQKYYELNREKLIADSMKYYEEHKEERLAVVAQYYQNHKEEKAEYNKLYLERMKNTDEYKQRRKLWENQNYEKLRQYHNLYKQEWSKNKRETNPQFVIMERLRARLRAALNGKQIKKVDRTIKLLGCSQIEFIIYIESLFSDGMSWENRHLWHIDHIRPCMSFDLTDPDQQRECFHYTNLQPLWAEDHRKKTITDFKSKR